jgi:CO dehydrogenase maturation factor
MVIAVSGKGGTGKSTLAALIVRHLIDRGERPVLAVDADPNSNFGDKLGVQPDRTIGGLREDALKQKHEASGTPKQRGIEYEIQQAVNEGSGFDLLSMGRGEGPGCYCSVNNMVRTFLHDLTSGYNHVVIDNEAGMEHLSRRTNDKVDLMIVVADRTPTGLKAAQRIAQLVRELDVVNGQMGLIINRVPERLCSEPPGVETGLVETGLPLLGCVPEDPLIEDFELHSKPLLGLPAACHALAAVHSILDNIEH